MCFGCQHWGFSTGIQFLELKLQTWDHFIFAYGIFLPLVQLVSNGKFKSSMHRVMANSIGPRISVAYFMSGPIERNKCYGPIKELVSEENPAVYREIQVLDYLKKVLNTGLDSYVGVDDYKL